MPLLTFGMSGTRSVTLVESWPAPRSTSKAPSEMVPAARDASQTSNVASGAGEGVIPHEQVVAIEDKVANEESEPQVNTELAQEDDLSSLAAEASSGNVPQTSDAEGSAQSETHMMELSVDSLPHLELTEAISVTVRSLGDRLVTASVDALNLSGTGDTVGDVLITVKEQIEVLYERLTKDSRLDEDEQNQLNILRHHIKSPGDQHKLRRMLWR
jgi:hypothetical protein